MTNHIKEKLVLYYVEEYGVVARVAQSVERRSYEPAVVGSSPTVSKCKKCLLSTKVAEWSIAHDLSSCPSGSWVRIPPLVILYFLF